MITSKSDVYYKKAVIEVENGNEESALNWLKQSIEINQNP